MDFGELLYINPKDQVQSPSIALEDSVVLGIYEGPHYVVSGSEGSGARALSLAS